MFAAGRFALASLVVAAGVAAPATRVPATTPAAAPPISKERRLTVVQGGPGVGEDTSSCGFRRATPMTCWGNREDLSHRPLPAAERGHRAGQPVEGARIP